MKKVGFILGILSLFFIPEGIAGSLDSLEQEARKLYASEIDSSESIARKVLKMASESGNSEKEAWALNWIAICFLQKGISDSVDAYLDQAIEIAETNDLEDLLGKARLNKSINRFQAGDYESAAQRGLQALEYYQAVGNEIGQAHARYNTGLSYQRLERPEKAMQFFREAYSVYRHEGSILQKANTLNAMGSAFEALQNPDSALLFYQQAVEVKLAANAWAYCGSEYSNIAALKASSGDSAEARNYYRKSFAAYEALGNVRGKGLVAGNLAGFAMASEQWDSALYFGRISLETLQPTDDRYLISNANLRLAKSYEALGKYREALIHLQTHDSLQKLISGAEVEKNMDEMLVKYETEKKEKELAEANLRTQRQRTWLAGAIGGIIALFITLALIVRNQQERKKRLLATARAELEAERNRISMDLHDHLGAELTIITSQLDTQAFRIQDETTRDKMQQLAEQTREANAQLRETIWSVRSEEISLAQLEGKVREFAGRVLAETGIGFIARRQGDGVLRPSVALTLYRVLQEGIHNARKYSGGSRIQLKMILKDHEIRITLEDDGTGFDPGQADRGYGLGNMRERIEGLNGTFQLETENGTAIHIAIPFPG